MLMSVEEKSLTLPEVAGRLNVSVTTIRRMIKRGHLKAFKVLGQLRVRESEVERIKQG